MILNDFVLSMIILIALWAGLAGSWNLLSGYIGQLSLGHVAFMGIGAYSSGILFTTYNVSPLIGMAVGILVSVLVAIIVGFATFRLKGPFFSMATIGIAEVLRNIAHLMKDVTKGSIGLTVPYKPGLENLVFESKWGYIGLCIVYLIIVMAVTYFINNNRFGYHLRSIAEDETAAECLGVNALTMKLKAFAISAALTSMGGTIWVQYVMFVDPESIFSFAYSIEMVILAMLGGAGTVIGPLLGSLLITPLTYILQEALRDYGSGLYLVIYGLILILVVLYLPKGLVGLWKDRRFKLKRRSLDGKPIEKFGNS
jgi:branched-chain amino acid transport system permease protein